jgi:hypothetical protein
MLRSPDSFANDHINVLVRIRPPVVVAEEESNLEHDPGADQCVFAIDEHTIQLIKSVSCRCEVCMMKKAELIMKARSANHQKVFKVDKTFDINSEQENVYAEIVGFIKSTVEGYNSTIMCYGSSGSGKTFTITGSMDAPGVIPRAIDDLFATVEAAKEAEPSSLFIIELSYVELYNNYFRNLIRDAVEEQARQHAGEATSHLDDSLSDDASAVTKNTTTTISDSLVKLPTFVHQSERIDIHESDRTGVFLSGNHLRIRVSSAEEAMRIVLQGNQFKTIGSTNSSELSARFELFFQ